MTDHGPSSPVSGTPPTIGTLVRPIASVTLFTLGTYLAALGIRVAMARMFGAGPDLDAFFAASALPQYFTAVLAGVLPQVVIPVVVITAHRSGNAEARQVAQGIVNVVLVAITVVTIMCAFFSSALLRLSAPGLNDATHDLATYIAWILWPTVVTSAAVAIAAGIENSENRFVRAALVPFLGGLFNLILIVALAPPFGVFGIAVAATAGSLVQLLFFGNTLTRGGLMVRASLALPGVREAASLLWPLLISGVFVRLTILAERYFGSRLAPGSISEISYASSMIGPLAMILSIGVGTVLFPRMSQQSATGNLAELGTSLSLAIRAMWVLIAPVILIGICLSRPAMEALFEGGRFTAEDTGHVASLLQVYLLGVAAAALGIVTGRVLYSLKAAHLLSIAGAIEGIAYVLYTALLVRRLGAAGVGWGFVIYVSASVCWHLAAITHRIHWRLWRTTAWSAARTTAAAIAAAGVARFVTGQFAAPWMALLLAGGASTVTFVIVLAITNRPDVNLMTSALSQLKGRREN